MEWSRQVISIVACCHSVKLCALAARAFQSWHKKYIFLSFACRIHENGQRWTCNLLEFGLKSCGIPIYWWISMLSFLLLIRFGLELMIFFWNSAQISVQFWGWRLLYKNFSNPLRLFIVFVLNVEPCLWPAKQVCSIVWHVIKSAELVGRSLIQSHFLTHHCYTLHIIFNNISKVHHYLYV